jgi:effector-binding domain-containing protein
VPEQPQIERRAAQPYVAIAVDVTMQALPDAVDRGFPELFQWLAAHSIEPAGPPFIRYLRIDMEGELTIELAAPLEVQPPGDEHVTVGVLPAGRYVTLLHVGPYDGLIAANAALQHWARERDITWQMDGDSTWRGRVERYLTDPSQQPDPSSWQTELAYLTTDG